MKPKWIDERICEQALGSLENGDRCPKLPKLFETLTEDERPKSLEHIRKTMLMVRKRLEREYDLCCCCINKELRISRNGGIIARSSSIKFPPESLEEAKLFLPGGKKGNKIAGLYFPEAKGDDLIYRASNERLAREGVHIHMRAIGLTALGVQNKVLPNSAFRALKETATEVVSQKLITMNEQLSFTNQQLKQLTTMFTSFVEKKRKRGKK